MYHRLWLIVNTALVVILTVYIWIISPHDSSSVVLAQLLAQIAVIFFIVNVNMYFIFLVIRNTSQRNVKIRLAKFSRALMKWHIKIGVSATILILAHALINLSKVGPLVGYTHVKFVSGYLAILMLSVTLFAGYLRYKKSSGFRRKFHLTSAMILLAAFLIHIFVLLN
ncbi:hypothetical protein E2K98_22340 [Bacillus salipaludis]|uniref:Uncharacterized protein n=1 Tax=Bacillus salipaludis TaxID=2547811 RepID=A0A4R5VLE0_9BACI|nr:hypothetical protein [Bacillus salipaludis]MDQ6595645.1 hypothetical protein [Bacillus salipaludis]TDK58594.1 hypothetical protein E2K98_22340 [Bacillus salipaludis]